MAINLEKYPHLQALAERKPAYRKAFAGLGSASPSLTIQKPFPPMAGVGTELKLLLKKFGIASLPNCKCGQRSREMDSNGIKWCEEHLEEIVDWLQEEAKNRHLPFVRTAGRILVRRAISNARRKDGVV